MVSIYAPTPIALVDRRRRRCRHAAAGKGRRQQVSRHGVCSLSADSEHPDFSVPGPS